MPTFPLSATTLCLWDFFALCLFLRRSTSLGMGGKEALRDRPTPSRKYFSFLIGLCIGRATMVRWEIRPSHVTSRRSEMVPSFFLLSLYDILLHGIYFCVFARAPLRYSSLSAISVVCCFRTQIIAREG